MTRFGWIVVLCFFAGAGILAGAAYVWHHRSAPTPVVEQSTATSTSAIDPSELAIYTSGEYGFSFFYPATAEVDDAFSGTTRAPLPWRVQAVATGVPIVRIISGTDEARVGVSSDAKEVAACSKQGPAETAQSVISVASTSWQQFSFAKVGTDNERQVTSYRTVHDAQCYVVEVLRPLTAAATSASSTAYTIKDIIMSFSFAS